MEIILFIHPVENEPSLDEKCLMSEMIIVN